MAKHGQAFQDIMLSQVHGFDAPGSFLSLCGWALLSRSICLHRMELSMSTAHNEVKLLYYQGHVCWEEEGDRRAEVICENDLPQAASFATKMAGEIGAIISGDLFPLGHVLRPTQTTVEPWPLALIAWTPGDQLPGPLGGKSQGCSNWLLATLPRPYRPWLCGPTGLLASSLLIPTIAVTASCPLCLSFQSLIGK